MSDLEKAQPSEADRRISVSDAEAPLLPVDKRLASRATRTPRTRGISTFCKAILVFGFLTCYFFYRSGVVSLPAYGSPDEMKISNGITKAPGYKLDEILEDSGTRFKASLSLRGEGSNAHGQDYDSVIFQAEYETAERLHIEIYDAAEKAYRIPSHLLEPSVSTHPTQRDLELHYKESPFAFWIERTSTHEVIFDTRFLSMPIHPRKMQRNGKEIRDTSMPAHPLILSDQYLQLSTAIPKDTNIYGLGEVIASSGIRRDPNATVQGYWNRDSAGSPHDSNLYGTHPFYIEKRLLPDGSYSSHGVFMRSSHGMDVLLRPGVLQYRLLGGIFDMYLFSGPSPTKVIQQYSEVVGKPAQMPFWTFGFHLCRFGYESIEETQEAVERMEKEGIPMESIWNDLDHMNHRRDFDLDARFPPEKFKKFTDWIHSRNQHYIPIVDVAIGTLMNESDHYPPYTTGHEADIFIHDKEGKEYVGQVWPGDTVFPDWTNPKTQGWWEQCLDEYRGKGVQYDGIWCDMNEPAAFDSEFDGKPKSEVEVIEAAEVVPVDKADGKDEEGEKDRFDYPSYAIHQDWKSLPDHTVPPSAQLHDGSRAYDSHNMYGLQEIIATHKALLKQMPDERPFILSRSTFAGQGKYSAHWLGDNYSTWQSLRDSLQGVLQFQWFHIPMVGPDSCGFAGNATEELCNRWTQLSAFFPFYRNHNSMEFTGQEPYQWGSVAVAAKQVLNIRYSLLPFWESLFAQAHRDGTPPLQPLFFEFDDPALASVEAQLLIGGRLLVSPVLHEGETKVTGFFPSQGGVTWRDWYTHEVVEVDSNDQAVLDAPLGHIPLHIRSGSILLVHNEPKYTLTETRESDLGLIINLDGESTATGEFIFDDGRTIDGAQTTISFTYEPDHRVSFVVSGDYVIPQRLSKITVLGLNKPPGYASSDGHVQWNAETGTAIMHDLKVDLNRAAVIDMSPR